MMDYYLKYLLIEPINTNSPYVKGPLYWAELPVNIRNENNKYKFKRIIKSMSINNYQNE